jgi:hypothetical protein
MDDFPADVNAAHDLLSPYFAKDRQASAHESGLTVRAYQNDGVMIPESFFVKIRSLLEFALRQCVDLSPDVDVSYSSRFCTNPNSCTPKYATDLDLRRFDFSDFERCDPSEANRLRFQCMTHEEARFVAGVYHFSLLIKGFRISTLGQNVLVECDAGLGIHSFSDYSGSIFSFSLPLNTIYERTKKGPL